jgi:hypothetical protein
VSKPFHQTENPAGRMVGESFKEYADRLYGMYRAALADQRVGGDLMGFDGKYGQVVTEFGDIPPTEPVVVFRAQDKLLPAVLDHYHLLAHNEGSPQKHLDLIEAALERVQEWQEENPTKVPDSSRHDVDGLRPLPEN